MKYIDSLREGMRISEVYLCKSKQIAVTKTGKEYADTIISELRKAELFAAEEIGIERMKQLNENMALFVELFSKAGGRKSNEANP